MKEKRAVCWKLQSKTGSILSPFFIFILLIYSFISIYPS